MKTENSENSKTENSNLERVNQHVVKLKGDHKTWDENYVESHEVRLFAAIFAFKLYYKDVNSPGKLKFLAGN
jgi:hypothetical protein